MCGKESDGGKAEAAFLAAEHGPTSSTPRREGAQSRSSYSCHGLLVLTCAALLGAPALAQNAWTQPEDGVFVQLSLTRIGPYDKLLGGSGPDVGTGREITETSLELYGEYGLAQHWTLVGNLPLRSVDAGDLQPGGTIASDTLTRPGNLFLGLRRQLVEGPVALAGQLGVEFPTGSSSVASGLATGLDAYTVQPSLTIGRGFGAAYAQAWLGLGLRSDGYSDDWRLGAETGYRFGKLLIAGNLEFVTSLTNGDVVLDPRFGQTGLYVDEQEYAAIGIKGLYDVSESFGLQAAVRGALSGKNVPSAPYLSLGAYFQR